MGEGRERKGRERSCRVDAVLRIDLSETAAFTAAVNFTHIKFDTCLEKGADIDPCSKTFNFHVRSRGLRFS